MNNQKKILGGSLVVLGALALLIGVSSASAYGGRASWFNSNPNCTPERRAQIEKALETNDYNAWKNLMDGRGRVAQVINEGNFSKFVEMHKLMKEGKTEEAQTIRKELGLGEGRGMGREMGRRNKDCQGNREANWQTNQNR